VNCPRCSAGLDDGARFCGACGYSLSATESSKNALPQQDPDFIGREIAGRYRIQAKLGEGGMGAVFRAEQISLKRQVAIKLLRPVLSADPNLVRRFNAEAELAAKLNHPNTVNIYDFGQDRDGTLFIAMEYVEGKSLRHVLTGAGPLPPRRALAIAGQIAASLADAHALGIVHRDLKPDNVMLTERGKNKDVVRVLDFGIAKLRDDNRQTMQAMTQAGDLVGTPQYMSPEQVRGDRVDGRADVYALGALLFEMLTGRLLFEGNSVFVIISRHLNDTPDRPSQRRPDLGLAPALDELCLAALAKDPMARIPSMEVFGERLAEIAASLGGPLSAAASVPYGGASAEVHTPTPPAMPPPTGPAPMPMAAFAGPPPVGPPVGPASAGQGAPVLGPPAAMTPGRAYGRPPGVPTTYPPGQLPVVPMMSSAGGMPVGAPVVAAPASAAPSPAMMTPYGASMGAAPAPVRAGGAALWVALGLLVVGLGAAGVVYLTSRGKDKKPATTPAADPGPDDGGDDDGDTPDPPPDDPWGGGGGATGGATGRPSANVPASGGTTTTTPSGASFQVPPGVKQVGRKQDDPAVMYMFRGEVGGVDTLFMVIEVTLEDGGAGAAGATIAASMGTVQSSSSRQLGPNSYPSFVVDISASEARDDELNPGWRGPIAAEFVVAVLDGDHRLFLVGVGSAPGQFAATEATRRDFFERRVKPVATP
jgi:predicted Ser/Thr protein kinase